MQKVQIELTIGEVAAIAQRSLAEKLSGEVCGVFSQLWKRIEERLEAEREKPKRLRVRG